MSQYSNPPNLLRGISDDNATFVTADDSNPDKAQREDASFLNTHQPPQRMEHVGYNTFDGYSYHDQNRVGTNAGYMPTGYQYGADAQNPVHHHSFGGLPYDHSGSYQFQQQNNGWENAEVQKDTRNMPFCGVEKIGEDEQPMKAFETHLLEEEELQATKSVVFDDKIASEESSESEDSGSDFDPRTENRKRRSYSSRRAVTRKVHKRAVSPSDDESISADGPAPEKMPKVLPKKSKFVPKTKPRNYKLKTEEERQMDPDYKMKRDRNNDAVRKSRKKSKEMEMKRKEEMERLRQENKTMRNELTILKSIPCIRCGLLPVKTEAIDEDFPHLSSSALTDS